jgi:lysosomal Pro-X carboxypeptidase
VKEAKFPSMMRLLSLLTLAHLTPQAQGAPFPGCKGGTLAGCPGAANCTVHTLTQNIDHFNWAAPLGDPARTTFEQRYFVYDRWWDRAAAGPVFFYFGNEDNVELYVNHTGLMWESAAEFGALLVFGEHRYYGTSLPYAQGTAGCMHFLTTEQAMADFAYLIDHVRTAWGAQDSAFIGFGGSYGGMLGAWFRVHYPNAIDGVIGARGPSPARPGAPCARARATRPGPLTCHGSRASFARSHSAHACSRIRPDLVLRWPPPGVRLQRVQ